MNNFSQPAQRPVVRNILHNRQVHGVHGAGKEDLRDEGFYYSYKNVDNYPSTRKRGAEVFFLHDLVSGYRPHSRPRYLRLGMAMDKIYRN